MNPPKLTDALLQVDSRVATLILNRHDVRNALTGTHLIDDIVAVADWVHRCEASGTAGQVGVPTVLSVGSGLRGRGHGTGAILHGAWVCHWLHSCRTTVPAKQSHHRACAPVAELEL